MNKRKLRSTYRKYVFGYHFEVVEPRPEPTLVQRVESLEPEATASLAGPRLRGVQARYRFTLQVAGQVHVSVSLKP